MGWDGKGSSMHCVWESGADLMSQVGVKGVGG